jgi:hypothetical protein
MPLLIDVPSPMQNLSRALADMLGLSRALQHTHSAAARHASTSGYRTLLAKSRNHTHFKKGNPWQVQNRLKILIRQAHCWLRSESFRIALPH